MDNKPIITDPEIDVLTGLYSRQAFFYYVKLRLYENADIDYVIVRWDVKRFKVINDLFGIHTGDSILKKIAANMIKYMGDDGIGGRLESDHFVMCLPLSTLDMEETVEWIREGFHELNLDYEINLDAGVYLIEDISLPIELMCDRAGLALQTIKENYQERYAFYDNMLREQLLLEQMITGEMRTALEKEQFQIYMQPQFNYVTGEIIGAEALVRWVHPVKGMIDPSQFISIFEKNGFISQLDRYVWEKTCQYIRGWLRRSEQVVPISVSVNISRMDIYNPGLSEILLDLVKEYEIPVSMLKLEITESAYVEHPKQLIEVVKRLQGYGFIVEMDDFGSGYSSLNTLKDVPVDVLKLDLKFLSDDDGSGKGGNILSSVVRMAQWLGLPVIAEGVETRSQADYLKSIGCYHMQGYYFAKPMKASELELLLESCAVERTPTFKNDWDLADENEFWNPDTQMALIFNDYVGGAGIFEYYKGNLEALRINEKYLEVMTYTREQHDAWHLHMLELILEEDRYKYIQMLDFCIDSGKEAQCEVRFLSANAGGKPVWILSKAKVIARSSERYMFFVTIENTTAEKERQTANDAQQFGNVIANLPVAMCIFEMDGMNVKPQYFSNQVYNLFGMDVNEYRKGAYGTRRFHEITNLSIKDLLKNIQYSNENGSSGEIVSTANKYNGQSIWIRFAYAVFQKEKDVQMCYATLYDVTESIENERNQRLQDERYRILSEKINAITFDYNVKEDRLIRSANGGMRAPDSEMVEKYTVNLASVSRVHPEDLDKWLECLQRTAQSAEEGILELRMNITGEKYQWSRVHYVSLAGDDGIVYRIIGRVDDIQAEKEKEEALRMKAEYDEPTGLYNKATTESLIDSRLTESTAGSASALFILDVDDFKNINDRMGHLFGDSFIKVVAAELKKLFRGSDITGRIGGDEFVAFLNGISDPVIVKRKADQLLEAFRQIKVPEVGNVRCSIGAAFSECGDTYHSLLQKADQALYKAKRKGKDCCIIYQQQENRQWIETGKATSPWGILPVERGASAAAESTIVRTLLHQVFELLYEGKDVETVIRSLLEITGIHFNVSRAYVMEAAQGRAFCRRTFEWCSESLGEAEETIICYFDINNYKENFNRDGIFYCRDVSELPGKQYEMLKRRNVKSLLQCAVMDGDVFCGYVGFDECGENRFWTQEQIDTLTFIAEVLSTFILKKREEEHE